MYGYNVYKASPFSAANAGTDPGFVHRRLWAITYNENNVAEWKDFTSIPKDSSSVVTAKLEKQGFRCSNYKVGGKWVRTYLTQILTLEACQHKCVEDRGKDCKLFAYSASKLQCTYTRKGTVCRIEKWRGFNVYRMPDRRLREAETDAGVEPVELVAGENLRELLAPGTQLKVPDGWKITHANAAYCEKGFTSSEIRSAFDYEREAKKSFNLLGGRLDLGPVSISYSSESREFRKNNGDSHQALIKTDAECLVYQMEMKDPKNPPKSSANFQWAVDQVGQGVGEQSDFYSLFDMYGTAYPTKLIFGARYGFSSYIDQSSYVDVKENSQKSSVSAEATAQLAGVKGIGVEATWEFQPAKPREQSRHRQQLNLSKR